MQNRTNTIEERLQIINDYIQRTMDALNATRQVVQGLASQAQGAQAQQPQQGWVGGPVGLSHSSFVGYPQVVQTPYGFVAVGTQLPQQAQLPQLQGFVPQYGLGHSSFGPQGWPMNLAPIGYNPMGFQQIPQVAANPVAHLPGQLGWQGGLSHSPFMPQPFAQTFGIPVQVPVQGFYGVSPFVQQQQMQQPGVGLSNPQIPVQGIGQNI